MVGADGTADLFLVVKFDISVGKIIRIECFVRCVNNLWPNEIFTFQKASYYIMGQLYQYLKAGLHYAANLLGPTVVSCISTERQEIFYLYIAAVQRDSAVTCPSLTESYVFSF